VTFKKRDILFFIILSILLVVSVITHLFSGQISVTIGDFYDSLTNFDHENTKQLIAREFRIPRITMAILAGAGLSIAGMLMQTLFNNPLAGPYVLGINSGSSLMVALSLMSGFSIFQSDLGIIFSALAGALVFGFIILGVSSYVKSHISLLLIGLMLGSFTSAFITVLQSLSTAQELKAFTIWTMGSLQQTQFDQLPIIILFFSIGIILSLYLIKPLNVLVLGEKTTEILGMNIRRIRLVVIIVTALFTGLITAFCGPIAFVGLAVPNLTRIVFKTQSHAVLLVANFFFGAIFLVLADTIIQLIEKTISLPINAFTSLIGAPLIILIVIKRLK